MSDDVAEVEEERQRQWRVALTVKCGFCGVPAAHLCRRSDFETHAFTDEPTAWPHWRRLKDAGYEGPMPDRRSSGSSAPSPRSQPG